MRTTHTNRVVRVLIALALSVLMSFPLIAEGQKEAEGDGDGDGGNPVKIGALMPMTGDLQAYGTADLRGPQLAAKQINEQGGVLGRQLDVVVGDTQTRPQAGIDAAQKLISVEGVYGIVGALSSGVTIPVAQSVSSSEQVPQISPASTSPVITGLEDQDFMFRTVPSDAFQGVALATLVQDAGYQNVATVYVNNDYGEGLANSFANNFDGNVSASLPYEQGNASYRGELQKAAANGAEALLLIGYPENGITILRQAIEQGYFDEFIFTDGMKAPEVIEAIGANNLNGSFGTVPQSLDTEAAELFKSAYEAEYGELPPKPYIDTAYDAAFVLALAAQKAGSTESVAVRDNLRSVANEPGTKILPGQWEKALEALENGEDVNYQGASGSIEFDDNGDVGGTIGHWVIEDGEIKTEKVFEPEM